MYYKRYKMKSDICINELIDVSSIDIVSSLSSHTSIASPLHISSQLNQSSVSLSTELTSGNDEKKNITEEPLPFTDSITLEFMMNKNIYHRYLEKRDNTKFLEIREKQKKIQKYKNNIRNISNYILDDLCDDIDDSKNQTRSQKYKYGLDIIENFNRFIEKCILHIETKDNHNNYNHEDDNILFSHCDDDDDDDDDNNRHYDCDDIHDMSSPLSLSSHITSVPYISQSFWGAKIKKI
jgi:hypothetical protein